MKQMKAWLVATALLSAGWLPAAALAQDGGAAQFAATTLNLSAQGEVRTPPDLAIVEIGVQAAAPSAAAAFAQARAKMATLVSTLHGQRVADDDVQTSQLTLQAQYVNGEDQAPRRLTGYLASNAVSVRLHDLGRVGPVVDALVAAGADAVNGISFQLADPTAAEDEARRRAVKALQAKAELYAEATGYHLKRLVSLSDGASSYAGTPMRVFAMRTARSSTPVAVGEMTVSVSLNAQYELVR